MNWSEIWDTILESPTETIALAVMALFFLICAITLIIRFIRWLYVSHSEKYEYIPYLDKYVRKETKNEKAQSIEKDDHRIP